MNLLEAEKEPLEQEKKALEEELMPFFEKGLQTVRVRIEMNGKKTTKTIYLHQQLWATLKERVPMQERIRALREAGLEEFVNEQYHSSSLSAYFRELDAEGEDLPEPLKDIFKPLDESVRYSLRIRSS